MLEVTFVENIADVDFSIGPHGVDIHRADIVFFDKPRVRSDDIPVAHESGEIHVWNGCQGRFFRRAGARGKGKEAESENGFHLGFSKSPTS